MTAKEMFEKNINLLNKNKPLEKLQRKLNYYNWLQHNLLAINKRMDEWLKKGETFFNIHSQYDIDLVYKIFRNKEQYTFGDEKYHYFHIKINKRGINKLAKMIEKADKELKVINKQIEELGWNNRKAFDRYCERKEIFK